MIEAAPTIESILPHLERALANPSIPARAHMAGRQLLDRLTSPIRVVVTGHPGSGKSQIINLLAGERIVPEGSSLPSLALRYGAHRTLTVHQADGTTATRPFGDLAALRRSDVGLVTIEAPLDVLQSLSLTEVVTGGTAEGERDGVLWAAERADIVLWCSLEFTPAEQWLWSAMPERLKDHGFLVLTKADTLIRSGLLEQRIAELEDIVAEEFHSLVPVATLQGLNALLADGGPDADALSASGAAALKDALARHVEQGRRADLDAALMFLSRFGSGQTADPAPLPPRPAPMPEADPPATAAHDARAPEPPSVAWAAEPDPSPLPVAEPDAPRTAIDLLTACARDLGDAACDADRAQVVLAQCSEAAQSVCDALEDGPAALHDEALDICDKLILMQQERSDEAAADAVTLLLQLRRDLALTTAV